MDTTNNIEQPPGIAVARLLLAFRKLEDGSLVERVEQLQGLARPVRQLIPSLILATPHSSVETQKPQASKESADVAKYLLCAWRKGIQQAIDQLMIEINTGGSSLAEKDAYWLLGEGLETDAFLLQRSRMRGWVAPKGAWVSTHLVTRRCAVFGTHWKGRKNKCIKLLRLYRLILTSAMIDEQSHGSLSDLKSSINRIAKSVQLIPSDLIDVDVDAEVWQVDQDSDYGPRFSALRHGDNNRSTYILADEHGAFLPMNILEH